MNQAHPPRRSNLLTPLQRVALPTVVVLGVAWWTAPPAFAAGDPLAVEQWNARDIRAPQAHRVTLGAGATVAVIDTGVDLTHPDLAQNVVAGPDFVDGDSSPDDEHGHGTHVAGIIAAQANNGIGIAGIAPAATILVIRVLDRAGLGSTDDEARGIDAAVAAGADVINLSLSTGPDAAKPSEGLGELVAAIERAARAGVVVVAAAGNFNLPWCAQPLVAARILCVGATTRQRRRAPYSDFADRVNIMAPGGQWSPGRDIVSTRRGGGYTREAGTSQATPHVAAVAALLASLGLRGEQIIDRIEQTATGLGRAGGDGVSGVYRHGIVDAAAAVAGLGPEGAAAAAVSARAPRSVRMTSVRSRGLPVRCRTTRAGSCTVSVYTKAGGLLARGARDMPANRTLVVRARLTRLGRHVLRGTTRTTSTLRVSVRDAPTISARVQFVR